jgi:hypothetical protein
MNDIYDQYDTRDFVTEKTPQTNVKATRSGMITEVEIAGQKFHSVDPVEFAKLENLLNNLKQRLLITEQMVRQLQGQLRLKDKQIVDIRNALDTKVSHDT